MKIFKKTFFLNYIFLILITIALVLRFYNLYNHATFLADQGRDAIIIYKLLTLQNIPAIGPPTSIGMVYLGPMYYYIIAPFLLLTNFNPIGLALGVGILSLAGLIASYFFVYNFISKYYANIFLFIATFFWFLVEFSRFSWNPNLLPYTAFITICLFYASTHSKKHKVPISIAAGFFLGASIQLHYLALALIPGLAIVQIYSFVKNKFSLKNSLLTLFLITLGFIISLFPFIIFEIKHNAVNTRAFIQILTSPKQGVDIHNTYLGRLQEVIYSAVSHLVHTSPRPIIAYILALFITTFAYINGSRKNKEFILFNIVVIVFFFLSFAIIQSPRHPHYYTPVYLSLIFLISISLPHKKGCRLCKLILVVLGFIYILVNAQFINRVVFQKGNRQIEKAKKVAQFIEKITKNKPYNIAALPFTYSEDPYVYFLMTKNKPPVNEKTLQFTKQMIVVCEKEPCRVTSSPLWEIAAFGPTKIAGKWKIENVFIYKLQ